MQCPMWGYATQALHGLPRPAVRSHYYNTHRTDHHRFPLHDLDLFGADLFPDLYDLAHVAGWEPYNLHVCSRTRFLGWICTIQILNSILGRRVGVYMV